MKKMVGSIISALSLSISLHAAEVSLTETQFLDMQELVEGSVDEFKAALQENASDLSFVFALLENLEKFDAYKVWDIHRNFAKLEATLLKRQKELPEIKGPKTRADLAIKERLTKINLPRFSQYMHELIIDSLTTLLALEWTLRIDRVNE